MSDHEKGSQTMKELLAEIGEHAVLLTLAGKARNTGWTVLKNIDARGYDILLRHTRTHREKQIEVKTRQRVWTTANDRNRSTAQFTVTRLERERAHFVICYWWERGWFFVVPARKLKRAGKKQYKFVVRAPKGGATPGGDAGRCLDRWSSISPEFCDGGPLSHGVAHDAAAERARRSVRPRTCVERAHAR